jgi:RNA polymerase sigma factor (sigma-70 family)
VARRATDWVRKPVVTALARAKVPTLEELFEREYDAMVRLAYVMMRNKGDAEEVVQDAFVDVKQRWATLLNPGGYLRTAVVHGARRRIARTGRRRQIINEKVAPQIALAVGPGEPEYLVDALGAIPERHRAALVLAYYVGLGPTEIADALGCRPGTAKSLVHRGLKQLRRELEDG